MSNRSTVALLVLGLLHTGMLAGCDDGSQGSALSEDASQDQRPADRDATVVSDSNAASVVDAGSGGGPDTRLGQQDAVGNLDDDAGSTAGADSVPDLVESRDAGKKDAPPTFDSAIEADPDVRATDATTGDVTMTDATMGIDVGKPADAPARADGKADGADVGTEIDSTLTPFCQSILLDNAGSPDTYPVLYREPASAAEIFSTRTAALRSAYGLGESDYAFEGVPISWATTIDQGMGPCALMLGGPITKDTVTATADGFLSQWGDLFHYKDDGRVSVSTSCFNKFCMAKFDQDYCGLPVFSDDPDYRGFASFTVYADSGCLNEAYTTFVPMIPVPRNALLSAEQLKQAIVGMTLTYSCATGQRTVEVSEQDPITMPDRPSVYVRKSPTVASALEYRLSIPVFVEVGGGMPWTIYVDGIDGTVLEDVAGFICD